MNKTTRKNEATLRQGEVLARLAKLAYYPAQGFQEMGAWYVVDEVLEAKADKPLESGPATLIHQEIEYSVTVQVMDCRPPSTTVTTSQIEIAYEEGLAKLAKLLGLLS